jgi:aminocarboxymuconate-semialdehyde decarboxylase
MFDLEGLLMGQEATLGPDVEVISSLSTLALLDEVHGEEALELAELFNAEMASAQARHAGFWGTAAVPLADPDAAVTVLEDAVARHDLRGVSLPGSINGSPVYRPELEPFYERAASLAMPLFLHPTDLALEGSFPDDVASAPQTAFEQVPGTSLGGALQLSLGRVFDSSIAAMRLVLSGVMDRYPDLRIIHFHAGGVLPYVAGRLDKNARAAGMSEPASSYVKRMYTDTVSQQPLSLRMAIDFYGPDHVCFGDDFPCWNPVAALEVLDTVGLSSEHRSQIMGGTIRRVVDLRPAAERAAVGVQGRDR